MKLTIDIPRSEYEDICNNAINYKNTVGNALLKAIALGEEQKTGYWISGHEETGALGITYTEKICSNCGWHHSLVIPKNYCPNCGAKNMVEPQERESEVDE